MKPHACLRVSAAVLGGAAVAGMLALGAVRGPNPAGPSAPLGPPPRLVLAPGAGTETAGSAATTTSMILSFRPTVTASIPPPPD